jgi:hypothetical protein
MDEMALALHIVCNYNEKKKGMDSTEEISHGEGPDHVVGLEREHTQVLEPTECGQ